MRFKSHIYFFVAVMVGIGLVTTVAQDIETTEEAQVVTASPTVTLTATQTPTSTLSLVPTIETAPAIPSLMPISATMPMVSISSSSTSEPTSTEIVTNISGTATATSTASITTPVSGTIQATEIVTNISGTATATSTVIITTPVSGTIQATETVTNISGTATATSTVTATITSTPTIMPTATIGALPLRYVQGIARYQNRSTNTNHVRIQVFTEEMILVSEVLANSNGIYSIAVPVQEAFWLVAIAEGHLESRVFLLPNQRIPVIVLLAGDVNQDGCIASDDILALQNSTDTASESTDFNGDGSTDMADLAMLAGNFDANCAAVEASASANQEALPAEATPEIIMTEILGDISHAVTATQTETPIIIEDIPVPLDMISGTGDLSNSEVSPNSSE